MAFPSHFAPDGTILRKVPDGIHKPFAVSMWDRNSTTTAFHDLSYISVFIDSAQYRLAKVKVTEEPRGELGLRVLVKQDQPHITGIKKPDEILGREPVVKQGITTPRPVQLFFNALEFSAVASDEKKCFPEAGQFSYGAGQKIQTMPDTQVSTEDEKTGLPGNPVLVADSHPPITTLHGHPAGITLYSHSRGITVLRR